MISVTADTPIESYFVNRQQELGLLDDYSKERGACIAVTGVAGIGKTTLLRVFERKVSSKFPGGVYHLSGHDGLSGLHRNLGSLKKEEGHALVVVDDVELLNSSDILSFYDSVVNKFLGSLVLSGRLIPISILPNVKILSLAGLNTTDLIKARLNLVHESVDIDKIIDIIDGNAALLQLLISTPRDALQKIHKLISPEIEIVPKATSTNIKNLKVDIQSEKDAGPDIFSLVLAVLLFIISSISAIKSEKRIVNEIQGIKEIVSEHFLATSHKDVVNEHYITTFVNLRSDPIIQKNNIITILAPNQTISVVSVSEGWAKVVYVDYVSSKKYDGWVCSKYIKPINKQN